MNLLWERDAPGGREDRPASLDLEASAMLVEKGGEMLLESAGWASCSIILVSLPWMQFLCEIMKNQSYQTKNPFSFQF